MKKLFLSFGLLTATLMFSQELSTDLKFMLKNDEPREFSTYVKKNDLNKCFKIKEEPYSLLALSIKLESKKVFERLIEEKADLNLACDEKTPLMFAAKYGKVDLAKILLKNGADKNLKTSKGLTALDYAKKYEQKELVEILK